MKEVLFVLYYFPPMGGSGVQRPLNWAKYLPEFGWKPIILCPEPGAYHTFDPSLLKKVEKANIEVHRINADTPFHRLGNTSRELKISQPIQSMFRSLMSWKYIPDNKVGWVENAVDKSLNLINQRDIKAVISSAPPYSNLLVSNRIKELTNVKFISDFRDEWLESHLINMPTRWHRNKHRKLEKNVLSNASMALTVNPVIAQQIKNRSDIDIQVLHHSFDPDDFTNPGENINRGDHIKILYSGTFYPDSTPESFLKAVSKLEKRGFFEKYKITLQFQGGLDKKITNLADQLGIQHLVEDLGYRNHDEAVKILKSADILWLNVGQKRNPHILSLGKIAEYIATKKPIIGLVPEGAARDILNQYNASYIANPYQINEISNTINKAVVDFTEKKNPIPDSDFIELFNARKQAETLSAYLNAIAYT